MTEPAVQVEATGETVGEARWAALHELERRYPALDRTAVEFVVLSEGQRGLLGVGYEPARVIATLSGAPPDAAPARAVAEPYPEDSPAAARVRALMARIVDGLGLDAAVTVVESDAGVAATVTGDDLGLLIGRHGHTIDAVQYLANAVMWRRHPEDRKEVVVDAAGYRGRRRVTLESLAVRSAERALSDREPVDLEPMTAIERKVVHLRLKEFDGVETTSEGTEPNRYVVVHPL